MKDIFFSNYYVFMYFDFKEKYRYTDNRKGSPYHYLAFMEEGNCKIVSDDGTVEIKEGDVFYIPDGLPYQSYWYGKPDIKFHSYGFKYFPETDTENFALQVVNCDEALTEKVKNVPFNSSPKSYELGVFYSCLNEIIPKLKLHGKSHDEQIYIKAHRIITSDPTLSAPQIAQKCGVSESSLYSAFKKASCKTPNEVKQEILCEKAVALLMSTGRSVQDISDSLGFSSTSYFRKVLKSYTDKTPREIRNKSKIM